MEKMDPSECTVHPDLYAAFINTYIHIYVRTYGAITFARQRLQILYNKELNRPRDASVFFFHYRALTASGRTYFRNPILIGYC